MSFRKSGKGKRELRQPRAILGDDKTLKLTRPCSCKKDPGREKTKGKSKFPEKNCQQRGRGGEKQSTQPQKEGS